MSKRVFDKNTEHDSIPTENEDNTLHDKPLIPASLLCNRTGRFLGLLVVVFIVAISLIFIFLTPSLEHLNGWAYALAIAGVSIVGAIVSVMVIIVIMNYYNYLGLRCPYCGGDISRIKIGGKYTEPGQPDDGRCRSCKRVVVDVNG
jgi:hypothetical protein